MHNPNRNSPLAHAALLLAAILLAIVAAGALAQPRAAIIRKAAVPGAAPAAPADDGDETNELSEKNFPGGAALKTDPEQQRLLKRAELCVEDGRLDLAAVLWQKVLDEAGDTLMTRDGRVYTSLAEEVERTLARLPPLALQTYRVSADGEAQAILAAASSDKQEDALSTVVRRYFLSSHGDEAAYQLACLALDRHDFVGASRLLSRILERHPDPSIPRGDLLLRLSVASARMGDKTTADKSLAQLATAPGIRPPSETVALVRQDVAQATTLANAALGPTGQDWHMDLANPTRSGHMTSLPSEATSRTLSELWVQEYPLALSNNQAMNQYGMMGMGAVIAFSGRMPTGQNQVTPISREELAAAWRQNGWMPTPKLLFDGGRVFIKTPDWLVCYNTSVLNDRPVWRPAWQNQFELDGMSQMTSMMAMQMFGGQMPQNSKPKSPAEIMLFGDRVHQSMSIAGEVLYSIEGKAIPKDGPRQPSAAQMKGFQWGVTPRRTRTNWLTAYSIAGGKVKWTRTASDEDKEGNTEVGFLAAPVPCGNLLLVPITDGGTIWLFGLSPEDGKTVWKSYLCDEPQGGANPWSPVTIAVEGREAYLTCGCGVVFTVDAVGGTVRWAIRYKRDGKPNTMMRNMGYQQGDTLDPSGWDDDVVIPYGRALVVMSSDCDKLLAIDRRTGDILWESPRISPFGSASSYCLGVNGRGLFVAGKNIIRRYDIPSGRLVWEKEIEDSFGRGCVTDDAVYVPVKDSILKLDAEKGREIIQVGVALTSDDPVGNLFSDGEKLWVVGAGRVYAMTTLEHRMKTLAEQIAAGDPDAQLNRMRLYYKQKQVAAALADLRGAYTLYQASLSADAAAQKLFAAMNELKLTQSQPLIALQLLHEAFVAAPSIPQLGKETVTRRSELIASAVGSIRQKKPAGGTATVLSIAPLIDEEYLIAAATLAVDASATPADVAALQAATTGGQPSSQMMAIRSLARLAPDAAKSPLQQLLPEGDDRVRLVAARALANLGETSILNTLAALLESPNSRVRAKSHQSLRALTGQQITFSPEGKPADRAKAVESWKTWVAANSATVKLTLPLTEQNVPLGRTLYVSQAQSLLVELDSEHKKRWETKLPGPAWGCQGLPNGHRLVAVYAQSLVIEYDADGKEIWRKEGLPGPPYSVQRLENGNTLVACADVQQVIEISPDGTLTTINVQGRPMSAQRLENGNTLVALQQGNRVVEVDRAGKITWEARTGNGPSHAVRLENGNTLVSLMYTRQVAEYGPNGKEIVWRSKVGLANPYCAQRLPNGKTLVSDHQGLREIDESGNAAGWEQKQPGITGISSF